MSVSGLLKDTCTVARPSATIAPDGTVTRTFATVATGVPCALVRLDHAATETEAGRPAQADARLFVRREADIRPVVGQAGGDRVTVGGEAFRVVAVEQTLPGRAPVKTLLLRRTE